GGLQAAVFAGMAVTVLCKSALVPGMRQIGVNEYFPPLPKIDLLLYRAPGSPNPAATALHDYLAHYLCMQPGTEPGDADAAAAAPAVENVHQISAAGKGRPAVQPGSRRFEGRSDPKNPSFLQPGSDDLQADRQAVRIEAARNGGSRQPRQIDRP